MTSPVDPLVLAERPLFIPLKAEWFDAFARGDKDTEYRPYGSRWNERTCRVGRALTLSYGYGKRRRISGTVVAFDIVGPEANNAIRRVYPTGDKFAAIKISVAPDTGGEPQSAAAQEGDR